MHSTQSLNLAPILDKIERAAHTMVALSRSIPEAQLAVAGQFWRHAAPIHVDRQPVLGFGDGMVYMDGQINNTEGARKRMEANAEEQTERGSIYIYPANEDDVSISFDVDLDEALIESIQEAMQANGQLDSLRQFASDHPVTDSNPFPAVAESLQLVTEHEKATAMGRYNNGGCFDLALAAVKEIPGARLGIGGTQAPFDEREITHGFVYLDDETVLDITGPQSIRQLEARLTGVSRGCREEIIETPWHSPVPEDDFIDAARHCGIEPSLYEAEASKFAFSRVHGTDLSQVGQQEDAATELKVTGLIR